MIVIHAISLPPGQFGGDCIDQFFTNCLDEKAHPYFSEIKDLHVSSHLLVDREGKVTQYVPFNLRAWHAGESQFQERHACNDFSIGIELEGCDEEAFAEQQYVMATRIVKVLMQHWPDISRDRIVGHADIAPGRKTDPGPMFDWKYFYSLIDEG